MTSLFLRKLHLSDFTQNGKWLFSEFASVLEILFYPTPLGYLNSDSGQHQTTSQAND